MTTPEDFRIDRTVGNLKGLVGGLVADKISGSPVDPDEDFVLIVPDVIIGSKDKIDALGALIRMTPTEFGILTREISAEGIQVLHERDKKVIGHELIRDKQKS